MTQITAMAQAQTTITPDSLPLGAASLEQTASAKQGGHTTKAGRELVKESTSTRMDRRTGRNATRERAQRLAGLLSGMLGTVSGTGSAGVEMMNVLHDPSLSIEEKIVLLSALMEDDLEHQLEGMLEQQAKGSLGQKTATGAGESQGWKELAGAAGTVVGAVAGAVAGGPGGATAGAAMGQALGNAIAGTGASPKTANTGNPKALEARIQLTLQRLNRSQTMLSNMLQAIHQTKRSVVSNIRV